MKNHNTYQLIKINASLKKVRNSEVRERLIMLKAYYQFDSLRSAGSQCGCSYGKVEYWKTRYEHDGLKGLSTRTSPGSPPKLDKDKSLEIKREILKKTSQHAGWQTKQIRDYIKKRAGITYSLRHTIRIAQNWGLSRITPRPQYAYAKKTNKQAFLKENQSNTRQ